MGARLQRSVPYIFDIMGCREDTDCGIPGICGNKTADNEHTHTSERSVWQMANGTLLSACAAQNSWPLPEGGEKGYREREGCGRRAVEEGAL